MKLTPNQKAKIELYVLDFCNSENPNHKERLKEEFNHFVRCKCRNKKTNGELKPINLYLAFENYLSGLGNMTPFENLHQEIILQDLGIVYNEINISETFYYLFTRAFAYQFKKHGFADFKKQHTLIEIK